ncbi:hypothetical protein BGZ76_010868 [Entomortierella beljakovae]|nr:hypothetical protein BGZ76_010868 [Entomortierella beljakovae]
MPRKESLAAAAASKNQRRQLSSDSGDDHDDHENDNDNDHENDENDNNNGDDAAPVKRKRLTQACDPCRKKKIKCDGVKPSCANCLKINANCTYLPSMKKRGPRQGYIELLEKRLDKMEQLLQHGPNAVDPELLDTKSVLSSRLRPGNRSSSPPASDGSSHIEPKSGSDPEGRYFGMTSGYSSLYDGHENKQQLIGTKSNISSALTLSERPKNPIYGIKDEIPRRDILEHLIELFFDSIYYQLPIVHPETFWKQFREGKVSPNLLNAMCAAVARFSNHPDVVTSPAFLAGEPFATNVRGMLVDSIDIPTVSNVQALVFLSMYEYGAARGPRAWMFGGMAVRQAQELGLNREDSSPVFHLKGDWVMRETRRRTFWACFMLDVLASSSSGRPRMMDERDCEVLLPSEDLDWCDQRPVVTEMLGDGEDSSSGAEQEQTASTKEQPQEKESGDSTQPQEPKATTTNSNTAEAEEEKDDEDQPSTKKNGVGHVLSSYAYLIRIVAILGKVSQYVNRPRSKKSIPPNQRGSEFSIIDAALTAWHKSVPPQLAYSLENGRMIENKGEGCTIVFMHVIYYTAVVLLHRPILAADKAAIQIDHSFVENSIARCTDAANRVSDVLEFVQSYNCPPRIYISSFFAYPVFTTATIHITNAFASDPAVAARARRSLSVHVRVLQTMKSYWSMADKFFYIIRDLYSIQSKISSSQQASQSTADQTTASSSKGPDEAHEEINALTRMRSDSTGNDGSTGKLASISSFLKSDSGLIALWRRATEMQVLDEAKQGQRLRSSPDEIVKHQEKSVYKEYNIPDQALREHRERMNALEIQQINQEFDRRWRSKIEEQGSQIDKESVEKAGGSNTNPDAPDSSKQTSVSNGSSNLDKRQTEDDSHNPRAAKQAKTAVSPTSSKSHDLNSHNRSSSDASVHSTTLSNNSQGVGSGSGIEQPSLASSTYRHSNIQQPSQLQDSYILQPMHIRPPQGSPSGVSGTMNIGSTTSPSLVPPRIYQQHNSISQSIDMMQNANIQRQRQQLQLQQEQATQMSSLAFGPSGTFSSPPYLHQQDQQGFSSQGQLSGSGFGLPLVYGSNYDNTQRMQTESLGSLFDFALPQEDISFLSNSFQVTPNMMQDNMGFNNLSNGSLASPMADMSSTTRTGPIMSGVSSATMSQGIGPQSPGSDPSNLFNISSRLHSFLMSDEPYGNNNGNANKSGMQGDTNKGVGSSVGNGVQATPTNLIRYLQLHHQQELHQQELQQQQNMQPVLNRQNSLIFDDIFPWNHFAATQQQQQSHQPHQPHQPPPPPL